ncbi:DUF4091 domain-containing protein [Arcanobacterium haemolyticum]|uniref:DUF4091 domain-containing protein n=1 Tax=Arcanobacterium haemolyticum TaxID=28264 RepID=UPI001C65ED80
MDPFWENNAGGGFISGDPFIVYPAPGGHVRESLRHHTSLNGEWRFRLHPTAQIDESREWETITLPCHWVFSFERGDARDPSFMGRIDRRYQCGRRRNRCLQRERKNINN